MPATDGKMRMTDVADQEQMFRLIQSIPSPKAESVWRLISKHLITFGKYMQTDDWKIIAEPLIKGSIYQVRITWKYTHDGSGLPYTL